MEEQKKLQEEMLKQMQDKQAGVIKKKKRMFSWLIDSIVINLFVIIFNVANKTVS